MSYKYYLRYILTFFFLSSYIYTNTHLISFIKNFKLFLFCLNQKRLKSRNDLNFYFFLLKLNFNKCNFFNIKSFRLGKKVKFCFLLKLNKKQSYYFLERFNFFIYAFASLDAYKNNYHCNDQFILKLKNFRSLEYFKFKEKKYYESFLLNFKQNCELQCFFTPQKKTSLFAQRNLLKSMNFPLTRF
jgi:hypothetical protein